MIVRVQVLHDDLNKRGGRTRDKVIMAVDKALGGAVWEAEGEDSWIVCQ